MDAKKAKLEDTYVFDEDVMDEMENFEVTQVLQETENDLSNTITQENKFLEDVEDSTVVLDQSSSKKKS